MFNLLICLFLAIYFLLSLYRLDWAVLLLIATLPSYLIRFQVFDIPATVLEGMILISFAVWFFGHTEFRNFIRGKYKIKDYFKNRRARISYPFGKEIILMLVISLIAVGVAHFSHNALGIWKAYFFEPALFFVLVLNVFVVNQEGGAPYIISLQKIILALAVSALAISAFAIFQEFTGLFLPTAYLTAAATRRATSFFPYPNAVGLFLGPLGLLFLGLLIAQIKNNPSQITDKFSISKYKIQNVFLSVTIILSLLAIYFAKSEGAMVGIVTGFIAFGLLANQRARRVTIIFVLLIAVGILAHAPTRKYVINKATLNDLSGQIRKQQWIETKKMFYAGAWFWGTGLDNYEAAVKPFHQEGIFVKNSDPDWLQKVLTSAAYRARVWQPTEIYHYPHNILLNFWTELGLFGMMLFIWIIAKYFFIFFRNWRAGSKNFSTSYAGYINFGLMGAMVVIIVHGLVDVPYFKNDLAVIFWLLTAMISIINLNLKYHEQSK